MDLILLRESYITEKQIDYIKIYIIAVRLVHRLGMVPLNVTVIPISIVPRNTIIAETHTFVKNGGVVAFWLHAHVFPIFPIYWGVVVDLTSRIV